VIQAALVLAAATAGGDLRPAVLIAVVTASSAALLILAAYERLPRALNRLLAVAATLVVTELTFLQPDGELYAPLYLGVAVYVAFFFNRTHAWLQLVATAALWGAVLLQAHSFSTALQIWILSAGTLVAAVSVMRTLRDRMQSVARHARRHSALLDAFFLHAPAGFGFLDADLRHVRVNEALAEIMAHARDEIEGHTLRELAPRNAHLLEPLARTVLESGKPVGGVEVENEAGRFHLVTYFPVPGLLGVGTAVTDVTHLKDVERRLEETNRRLTVLATTDELTRLPNRRLLDEQLELALARARRGGLAVAVLCFDLDNFKQVNDTLGHAVGDELLVEVASRLRAGARDTDVVARLGGDEFVVVLADLDVQEAPALAAGVVERIRLLLADPLPVGPVELGADASVGVSIYPLDSRDAKGLLAAADAAMYLGKAALTRVA
jgi:diguanylate cyclase (GGDEF)-like protein/PAS domain S-box-containing protein